MNMDEVFTAIAADPVAAVSKSLGRTESPFMARLPDHMHAGIAKYVLTGIVPGSFLRAVFAGELELAERHADPTNKPLLEVYGDFLEFEAPPDCWGSPKRVQEWVERGGLFGKVAA